MPLVTNQVSGNIYISVDPTPQDSPPTDTLEMTSKESTI